MAKMTLEELRALRGERKSDIEKRNNDGKTMQVIVGMGTCGIAAGAKDTLDAFITALDKKGLSESTVLRQSGCMGLCSHEPTVEVSVPGMEAVIYGDVKPALVGRIIDSHLIDKKPVSDLIVGHRTADV